MKEKIVANYKTVCTKVKKYKNTSIVNGVSDLNTFLCNIVANKENHDKEPRR